MKIKTYILWRDDRGGMLVKDTTKSHDHKGKEYTASLSTFGLIVLWACVILLIIVGLGGLYGFFYYILHPNEKDAMDLVFVSAFVVLFMAISVYALIRNIYVSNKKDYRYRFYEDKIVEMYFDEKEITKEILTQNINHVLIGNITEKITVAVGRRVRNTYKYGFLIVIKHHNKYFTREVYNQGELDTWIDFLRNNEIPVHVTEYDLRTAYNLHKRFPNEIKFEKVDDSILLGDTTKYLAMKWDKFTHVLSYWNSEEFDEMLRQYHTERDKKIQFNTWIGFIVFGLIIGWQMVFTHSESVDYWDQEGAIALHVGMSTMIVLYMGAMRSIAKFRLLILSYFVFTIAITISIAISGIFLGLTAEVFWLPWEINFTSFLIGWLPVFIIARIIRFLGS